MTITECPNCGRIWLRCPECGEIYEHGKESHCRHKACQAVNAPLDCEGCGLVAEHDRQGVLNYDMELIPYRAKQ